MREQFIKIKSEKGFTLLEMLLVVALTATLTVGLMDITQDWLDRQLTDTAGEHLVEVSEAVEEYLIANAFADIDETSDEGPAAVSNITSDILANYPSISLTSPLRVDYEIYLRKVAGPPAYVEALIYSSGDPIEYKKALRVARAAGNYGGITANIGPEDDRTSATGAFNTWSIDLNDFTFSDASTVANKTLATSADDGAQVLAYVPVMKQNKTAGPYLYRIDDCDGDGTPNPECNTMFANLDMSRNDINNASNVSTETMSVSDVASIGTLNVEGETTLNGSLTVNGDSTFESDVEITNSNLTVSTGNLVVNNGRVEAEEAEVVNLQVSDSIVSDTITADDGMRVTNANAVITDSITVSGGSVDVNVDGTVTLGSLDVTELDTNTLNTNNIGVTGQASISGEVNTNTVITDILITEKSCIGSGPEEQEYPSGSGAC